VTELTVDTQLSPEDTRTLFDGRTVNAFEDVEVTAEQMRGIYDLTKMGPTAFNSQPLRIVWVPRGEARERLVSHMSSGNKAKTEAAPMVAVLAMDEKWHHRFADFLPARPQIGQMYLDDEDFASAAGRDNAFIQVGYFVMAVRAMGLAAGPMTGFDAAGVNEDLLAERGLRSLVVVNIGKGVEPEHGRGPRFSFEDSTITL
jgi:3-hydroxypropanoate dehydrogenase